MLLFSGLTGLLADRVAGIVRREGVILRASEPALILFFSLAVGYYTCGKPPAWVPMPWVLAGVWMFWPALSIWHA